jgi:branched-chain amino acid aminotransferase
MKRLVNFAATSGSDETHLAGTKTVQIAHSSEGRMPVRNIWFKGSIVPVEQANISVLSPTAQFGLNVFEGIRCYASGDGQLFAFRLNEHFGRLLDSCKLLGISSPHQASELKDHLIQTIRANDYHEDVGVRLTLFVDGEGSWSSEGPVEMFIAPLPKPRIDVQAPPALSACVTTWERINDNCLPPRIKTGANYINSRYAYLEAKRHGYNCPIFLGRDGKVTEGTGACLFMVRRGILTTPTLTSSVLESITRSTVITLASDLGVQVMERDIDRTELYLAEELFLCGTAAELTPIASIDRVSVGSGRPGHVTMSLLRKYLEVVSNQLSRYSDWLAPIY